MKTENTTTLTERTQGRGEWINTLEDFYKVKNKFSNNADLIRRVIAKVNRDVVSPLQDERDKLKAINDSLLNALKESFEVLKGARTVTGIPFEYIYKDTFQKVDEAIKKAEE